MEEYRKHDKPAAASAVEQQDVAMNAWQMMVADFDAEMGDGKETFTQKPTLQSIQEEYAIYVLGATPGSTFDTLGFWKVRFLHFHRNIYSH